MGFLNDLLNPIKHIKDVKSGIKAIGRGDIKGALLPGGLPGSSPKTPPSAMPGAPTAATAPMAPGADQYYGDMADPAYGSFTQPFDVEQFYKYQDPGYAFQLQQGQQAVQNRNSAGSGALSGAAYKDLIGYNQGMASTSYGDAFNRYQTTQGNIFSRLSELAGLGQNAAAGVGNQGTQLAGNAGQFLSNAGTAAGAGIVGAGNALSSGATNAWLWRGMQPQGAGSTPIYGNDF